MMYGKMFETAQNRVQMRIQSREIIRPMDTVCVICAKTGHLYSGVSHSGMFRGQLTVTHAEIEAIQNMRAFREQQVEAVLLINAYNFRAMLPCPQCVSEILKMDDENKNCHIVLENTIVPVMGLDKFIQDSINQSQLASAQMPVGNNTQILHCHPRR
ncbi:MAG: hypothetical protein IJ644_02500 [Oscillospiraceae bacterium]|nr:hypothetical protein [Oscillospiraceae bacterium]